LFKKMMAIAYYIRYSSNKSWINLGGKIWIRIYQMWERF
jgi:hypothetical protein